jgi:hypothetical protein
MNRPSHRVYMTFFARSGWQARFLEADLNDSPAQKADVQ